MEEALLKEQCEWESGGSPYCSADLDRAKSKQRTPLLSNATVLQTFQKGSFAPGWSW